MCELNLDRKIVAVVDDHEPLLNAIRGILEAYGAKVLIYTSGHDFLRDMPFVHCLVIDYSMPDLSGLDLAFELRQRGYEPPVIMLTGMVNEIPEDRLAESGVREVVDKLLGHEALLRAIHAAARASPE